MASSPDAFCACSACLCNVPHACALQEAESAQRQYVQLRREHEALQNSINSQVGGMCSSHMGTINPFIGVHWCGSRALVVGPHKVAMFERLANARMRHMLVISGL